MVNMSETFITRVKDDRARRIVIDKKAWDDEKLKKDDYIRVTIEKITI